MEGSDRERCLVAYSSCFRRAKLRCPFGRRLFGPILLWYKWWIRPRPSCWFHSWSSRKTPSWRRLRRPEHLRGLRWMSLRIERKYRPMGIRDRRGRGLRWRRETLRTVSEIIVSHSELSPFLFKTSCKFAASPQKVNPPSNGERIWRLF